MKNHGLKFVLAANMGLLLATAGCSQTEQNPDGAQNEITASLPSEVDASQTDNAEMIAANVAAGMNWFGGPVYTGEPALDVTAALVKAGGGADAFSFEKALVSMLGEDTVKAEIAALTEKYGAEDVQSFVMGMDFAVKAALQRATEAGIALPEPAKLEGAELAKTLVQAGTAPDGAFWSGYLFDKALSHDLHNQVMGDIENQRGAREDLNVHRILNQAMYDVAQALGLKEVKLASLH